jgi:transposase InsO family protein
MAFPPKRGEKRGPQTVARCADDPGIALNVDLCFVPATRSQTEDKLPAVSGSSGHLVISTQTESDPHFPGQVFADDSLEYEQAMLKFVAASQAPPQPTELSSVGSIPSVKAQRRFLRQEEEGLRSARRIVRQQRKQEDADEKALKEERGQQKTTPAAKTPLERRAHSNAWCAVRAQRKHTLERRTTEDALWRSQRNGLRERFTSLPLVTAWIAILVVTDNCTRQCLGLPIFVAGLKVTAQVIISALWALLPAELQFLITDRGTHFKADAFKELARNQEFVHVVIAPHRPQSNGIAERLVRTLKEWLKDKTWQDDQQLAALLGQFLAEYNDRPHQGLPLTGLSPNEFAKRIWLM